MLFDTLSPQQEDIKHTVTPAQNHLQQDFPYDQTDNQIDDQTTQDESSNIRKGQTTLPNLPKIGHGYIWFIAWTLTAVYTSSHASRHNPIDSICY